MWEPQPLTTLRASEACRGENFTFTLRAFNIGTLNLLDELLEDTGSDHQSSTALSKTSTFHHTSPQEA
jgi:hypothetical protein